MSLTKADIVQTIQDQSSYTKAQALGLIESILELIRNSLAVGYDVMTSGFGKFKVNEKTERLGRNPATGEFVILEPQRVITFEYSGNLREKVNP